MKRAAAILPMIGILAALAGTSHGQTDGPVTSAIQATFKIANPGSTATCFVVAAPKSDDATQSDLYLVTAGHVLDKMKGNEARLVLRKKQDNETFVRHEVTVPVRSDGGPLWVKHPDLDIAVMELHVPEPSLIRPIPLQSVADSDRVADGLFAGGDAVCILSYPAQVEANGAGFPIVRRGTIASYPLAPVKAHRTFLIDFNTFAGDSGSPVVLLPSPTTNVEGSDPVILGLVIGQHIHEERFKLSHQETVIRHRLGIGIALHAAFIREAIQALRERDAG